MSVNNSNVTWVFFKAVYHANPGVERDFAGSKWKILKFSKTSAKSNVPLLRYKLWYSSKFFYF